jgi:hypothetical protein
MKRSYIIGAIILMLVLAGCGEPEPEVQCPASCDDANPCTTDSCSKDTGNMCRNTPIPGCSADCGVPCTGDVGMYMEMQCDPVLKQCASAPKAGLQQSISAQTKELQGVGGNKFKASTQFNLPFNTKKNVFGIKISASAIGTGVSNLVIKKIEITGVDANRQTVTLGEKTVNRPLWTTDDSIEEDVRIDFPTSANDGSFTSIKANIDYDYKYSFGTQMQDKTGKTPLLLTGITFTWFKPSMTQACPLSCDDGNEGTADKCSAATGYFCENEPIPGKCGNYACDIDENKCTCPADCGPCTGDAGKYLNYICQESECRTMIKPGTVPQPTPITDDRTLGPVYLQNTYAFNNPFDITKDKFNLEFKLYNKNDAVGAVKVVEARILESNIELGSVEVNGNLNAVGSSATKLLPITAFAGIESDKSLSLKVYLEYQYTTTSGTELRKIDFTKPFGIITLINPTAKT